MQFSVPRTEVCILSVVRSGKRVYNNRKTFCRAHTITFTKVEVCMSMLRIEYSVFYYIVSEVDLQIYLIY